MVSQDNKALDQQFVEQVINNGKTELIKDFYAPEIVGHVLADAPRLRQAFPDLHYIIEDQVAENDKVVTRWTATGTHRGELFSALSAGSPSIPPTGKMVSWTGVTISRFAGGKYVEQWINVDMLSVLHQLGATIRFALV